MIVTDERRGDVFTLSEARGRGTNNIAEFLALLEALAYATEHDPRATIFMDSEMVVKGYEKEWSYKKTPHLAKLQREALVYKELLPHVRLRWIPRERNAMADALSNTPEAMTMNYEKGIEQADLQEMEAKAAYS